MFNTSTQMKHWTFPSTAEIERLREEANQRYIQENCERFKKVPGACVTNDPERDEQIRSDFFLDSVEEEKIRKHYEYVLRDFCTGFDPAMPKYVMGTAMAFFKRIYLHNSVMDYHPRDLVYVCVYLACKVEEFNLSITQFVANMRHPSHQAVDMIVSQELLLMQILQYHLTIHNPYRPVEGLLIDVRTRCPEITDPERLRSGIDDFLEKALFTDVSLLFAPSQIALAALLASGNNLGLSNTISKYLANKLVDSEGRDVFVKLVDRCNKIRQIVKSVETDDKHEVQALKVKLSRCRNSENDPEHPSYRHRLMDAEEEGEETRQQKRMRLDEEDALREDMLLK